MINGPNYKNKIEEIIVFEKKCKGQQCPSQFNCILSDLLEIYLIYIYLT